MAKKAPPAAAKKAASGRKAAVKEAAVQDAALDAKPEAGEETATEETTEAAEEPTREAPAMEASGEPTDFDHLLDLSRAIDPKFGSETAKEGTQHFLIRMLTALAESTTEQFDTLPITAQTWYENACAEGNAKKDITPPDGYASPAAIVAEKKSAAKAEKKAAAPKKEAGAKKERTPREPKAPKEKKVREASKTFPIRLAVAADPTISLAALTEQLPSTGKTTLSTLRADTVAALRAAIQCGWTPPKGVSMPV